MNTHGPLSPIGGGNANAALFRATPREGVCARATPLPIDDMWPGLRSKGIIARSLVLCDSLPKLNFFFEAVIGCDYRFVEHIAESWNTGSNASGTRETSRLIKHFFISWTKTNYLRSLKDNNFKYLCIRNKKYMYVWICIFSSRKKRKYMKIYFRR